MRSLVWFRDRDLRWEDHEALAWGAEGELVPLFVAEPDVLDGPNAGRAAQVRGALHALARALRSRGSGHLVAEGRAEDLLPPLARACGADQVLAQEETDPSGRARDGRVEKGLAALGIPFRATGGQVLMGPGRLTTGKGEPFSVFTPFARAFQRQVPIPPPLPAPPRLPSLPAGLPGDLALAPEGPPEAEGAQDRLDRFLDGPLEGYREGRDRMDLPGTSRLSPDLACGALSPRMVWRAVSARAGAGEGDSARAYLRELLWREFAHYLLRERPRLLEEPFRAAFQGFPWTPDQAAFQAWAEGRTGYPVVDAAARQLLGEGFVHNRARMIAASFLAKDLLVPYGWGEAHYARHLADADPASNNLGWQWSAGCGCDAQPWFRVFSPVLQGERFDPLGSYVKRWVPELEGLPPRWVHRPWEAPEGELRKAGVVLGKTYPAPRVDHGAARLRFLERAKAWLGRPSI
jgi:deoxyribodipyrimidine photo-lyase